MILVACAVAALLLAGCGDHHSPAPRGAKPRTPASTSVVMIEVPGVRTGTGWVYSAPDGLVITSFHVTNGAAEVKVKVGRQPSRRAAVVAAAPCEDVALLAVSNTRGLRTMPLGTHSRLAVGTPVSAAGYTVDGGRRRWRSRTGW
jgi:S1-C subfamily serine protease